MPLYYKSLTAQMKSFNKNNKLQGLNDELHNLALKELLNKDNAIYNQEANKLQRQHLKDTIRERLNPEYHKEKALRKAKKAVEHEYLTNEYKKEHNKNKIIVSNQDRHNIQSLTLNKTQIEDLNKKYNLGLNTVGTTNKFNQELLKKYLL